MKKKINSNKINTTIKYDFSILHNKESEMLTNLISSNLAHHAWLITGVKGVGKFDFIQNAVKKIFTQNVGSLEKVNSVLWQIDNNTYSNLMIIRKQDGKKNIAVEDIRKINSFLTLSASDDNCKIIIIDNVDDLNVNSANALLKILEEPPNNCFLFLINHSEAKLQKTIKSRCSIVRLKISEPSRSLEIVRKNYSNIDAELFEKLLSITGNSPGLATKLISYDILSYYTDLLNLLNNGCHYGEITKFIEKVSMVTAEDSNLVISLMLNHVIVNIVKSLYAVEYPEIIDQEADIITKLAQKKKLDKWFDVYVKQKTLMLDQIRSNLDFKQVFLIVVNIINSV